MCYVTIVIKLKVLLDFLFIDIIQYKKYQLIEIEISQLSLFSQLFDPKMGPNDPRLLKRNKSTLNLYTSTSKMFICVFKIPVHADLPVGNNLQDHTMFLMHFMINVSYSISSTKLRGFGPQLQYKLLKTGKFYL